MPTKAKPTEEIPTEKECFVISPIGDEGSDIRHRSDQVLQHVITPAVESCGYTKVIRADRIAEPGIITSQIITHLLNSSLVVADLTGQNPNVYYELAIRHATRKPFVQLIQSGEKPPFDLAWVRTINLDHRDLDSVASCRQEIINQIKSVEESELIVDNPIMAAINLQSLRQSDNALDNSVADILSTLEDLQTDVKNLGDYPLTVGNGKILKS